MWTPLTKQGSPLIYCVFPRIYLPTKSDASSSSCSKTSSHTPSSSSLRPTPYLRVRGCLMLFSRNPASCNQRAMVCEGGESTKLPPFCQTFNLDYGKHQHSSQRPRGQDPPAIQDPLTGSIVTKCVTESPPVLAAENRALSMYVQASIKPKPPYLHISAQRARGCDRWYGVQAPSSVERPRPQAC